jgi:hypothetical protein
MKRLWLFLALALSITSNAQVYSQEDRAKKDLVQAVEALAKKDVVLTGTVAEEKPDAGKPGFPNITIASNLGGGGGVPFSGPVEMLCTQVGESIVVSADKLPNIKVYRLEEKTLCVQSHTEEPFHVSTLMDQLGRLTAWEDLAQAISEASRVRVNARGNDTEVRVVLDSGYIPVKENKPPVVGGGNVKIQVQGGPQAPSVIDLTATFVLNPSKEITSMEFALQYDDPMQAMFAKAMKGGPIGGGGGVIRIGGGAPANKDAKDGDDVLGKLNKLSFKVSDAPSKAIQSFASEARELLK